MNGKPLRVSEQNFDETYLNKLFHQENLLGAIYFKGAAGSHVFVMGSPIVAEAAVSQS